MIIDRRELGVMILFGLLMAVATLFFLGCVTKTELRHAQLAEYRKGLKVGRVIGRDEILGSLTSPECFKQDVNELANPAKEDDEEWLKKADEDLKAMENPQK